MKGSSSSHIFLTNSRASLMVISFILVTCTCSGTGIFTSVPVTQYVYLDHTVTFECTVNSTGYTVNFIYGRDVSPVETATANGYGKRTTFTATNESNGTDIFCTARMGNMPVISTGIAYIFIQGLPNEVNNLYGYQLDPCCMLFTWYPPFTLPGLSVEYIVSIGSSVDHELISITNYTYCPLNLTNGYYMINVTTTNGAGNGSTTNTSVSFQTDPYLVVMYDQNLTYHIANNWTLQFQIQDYKPCHSTIGRTTVTSCNINNSSDCYSTDSVVISNSTIVATAILPSHIMYNTFVHMEYENGQIFQSQETNIISTHDLQYVTITATTANQLCLQFQFVKGSTSNEVYLQFVSNTLNYILNVTISQTDRLSFTECIDILPANNWTLYACDGPHDPCIDNPAVTISDIIIAINSISASKASLVTLFPTMHQSVSLSSLIMTAIDSTITVSTVSLPEISTTSTPNPSFGPPSPRQNGLTSGAIAGIIIGILAIFLTGFLSSIAVIIMIRRIQIKLRDSSASNGVPISSHELNQDSFANQQPQNLFEYLYSETMVDKPSVTLKYVDVDVEPDPNAPAVPPPFDPNPAPYSEVTVAAAMISEEAAMYDRVSHQDQLSNHCASNSNYSKLNHNFPKLSDQTASSDIQLYNRCEHHARPFVPPTGQVFSQYSTLSVSRPTDSGCNKMTTLYLIQKELTHRVLSEHVAPHLTNKWREVGLALALTPPQLDDIEENHQGISDVFQMWEELETRPFNWETLLTILRSSIVNECELANHLEGQKI